MRLLTLTIEEIDEVVKEMDKESKAIKTELLRMCWFMRGGMTLEEAYNLDNETREIISNIVEKNLETTKETKMPFF
jgi:hypothetical protein